MILRDRKEVPVPKRLTDAESPGQRELAMVKAWIDAGAVPADRPDFKAYKDSEVTLTLERMFHGKCAYCESPYARTQPVDIEHWRPKAEVEVAGVKDPLPGYPWLAMSWENLLPSCIDCNRARKQHVLRPGEDGRLAWVPVLLGKANQFPVATGSARLKRYDEPLTNEVHLLVDPCTDDPKQYFRFDPDGIILPLISDPTLEDATRKRERALASIEVYALNRKGLVDERKERILLLGTRFELIRALIDLEARLARSIPLTDDQRAMRAILNSLIDTEVEHLVAQCEPHQPYTLMTKQFVREFLESIART